jgi:hypothetical protein
MNLVLIGALVIASFVALSRSAQAGNRLAATMATVESLALLAAAGLGTLAAAVYFDLKCDEGCDESASPDVRTGRWFDSQDAWQWWAQLGLALAGLLAASAFVYLTMRRRYRDALVVLLVGVGCFAAWAAMVAPFGDRFGI